MKSPVVLLLPLLLLSCSPDSADAPDFPMREVIIGDAPILQIGVREGRVEEQFHIITNVVALGDTALAVVDAGALELRFFSLGGGYLGSMGGSGDGPGEFRTISASWAHPEGGVEVVDAILARATHYTPSRDHATRRLPGDPDWPFLAAMFEGRSGSRWVMQTNAFVPFPEPGEAATLFSTIRVFSPEDGFADEVIAARSVTWYTPPSGRSVRLPLHLTPLPRVRGGLGTVGALDPHNHTLSVLRGGGGVDPCGAPPAVPPHPDGALRSR